ncbi:MAG: hypothetical protein ACK5LS_08160 [Propioniciclava sp.]
MESADLATLVARATDPDTTDPRAGLTAVTTLRRLVDALELQQVDNAVSTGLTWAEIAAALGVTRQAAHQRFARRICGTLVRTNR